MGAGYEESPRREHEAPQGNNKVAKDRTIPELLAFHGIRTVYPVTGTFSLPAMDVDRILSPFYIFNDCTFRPSIVHKSSPSYLTNIRSLWDIICLLDSS